MKSVQYNGRQDPGWYVLAIMLQMYGLELISKVSHSYNKPKYPLFACVYATQAKMKCQFSPSAHLVHI